MFLTIPSFSLSNWLFCNRDEAVCSLYLWVELPVLCLTTRDGVEWGRDEQRDRARSAVGRRCRRLQNNVGIGYDPMGCLARTRGIFHPVIVGVQIL